MPKKVLCVNRCKVHWKFVHPKFDFNAKIQNFIEYFYPLNLNFNADFQKLNAEVPFTYSLELCDLKKKKSALSGAMNLTTMKDYPGQQVL